MLAFPPRAVLVIAGVPGAGKTTFIRRTHKEGRVRVLDSQDVHDRYRRWLGSARGYPLYRPLVHVEHYVRIVAALLGGGSVIVHETGTRPWMRRMIARLARARGRTAHLLFIDVTPDAAQESQHRRGRAVRLRPMARHLARWARLQGRLAAGDDLVAREGYASCIVCTREQASRVRLLSFAAKAARPAPRAGMLMGWSPRAASVLLALAFVAACTAAPEIAPPRIEPAGADPVPLLQQLIRLDTRNPGGKTLPVAQLLRREFDAVGAQTEIIATPTPGVVHLIARIKGSGEKPPVLLAAHSDVVPFDTARWTVDPLGGEIKDGWVYGRGALDFKGGLAVFSTAVLRMAREQISLDRDVIMLAEAEEERGTYNTEWLARHHWDKINAGMALNEGGWILDGPDGKPAQVTISTADKIYAVLTLRAMATSTHASRPLPGSAIVRLSTAVAKLGGYDTPVTLNAQTREYFAALAERSAPPLSGAARRLVEATTQAERDQAGQDVVRLSGYQPLYHALMRNTLAYTVQRAGEKENVIPGSAEATINVRLVPGGSTPFDVAEQIRAVIADPEVTVTVQLPRPGMTEQQVRDLYEQAARQQPSSTSTDLYRALVEQARAQWPTAVVSPGLFEASTDARAWRSRGVPVYGIYPYPLDNDTLERMHGNDERIEVSSLREGAEMIYRVLKQVAAH